MRKLYDTEISGNCYKVRLMLSFLGLEYESIPVNLKERQQKTPEFLQMNILGQVPVLEDGEIRIRDSQAILAYLSRKYGQNDWLPEDAENLARIMQWLSNAANEIANGLAAARAFYAFRGNEIDIERVTARSHGILAAMNDHLADKEWLETGRPTVADIACFPYIALAKEGHIETAKYPNVTAWLSRFKMLPGFVPMPGIT